MGGKTRRLQDSIPDRPARSSVAIPTELPDTHLKYLSDFPDYVIWSAIRLKRKTFASKQIGDFTHFYYKKERKE